MCALQLGNLLESSFAKAEIEVTSTFQSILIKMLQTLLLLLFFFLNLLVIFYYKIDIYYVSKSDLYTLQATPRGERNILSGKYKIERYRCDLFAVVIYIVWHFSILIIKNYFFCDKAAALNRDDFMHSTS